MIVYHELSWSKNYVIPIMVVIIYNNLNFDLTNSNAKT